MKREKGFTLIELLSVVVVLGITFMIVLPKLVGLISDGEEKEIELIEERVLSAAKDYVNYIDGSFYTKLFKEGDTNYIYKTDLIKSGLLEKEEITRLDTFAGVKGELLEDDKIKYTVEYIDAEPEEYTNEELYLMYQNMNDRLNNLGGGSTGGSGESVDTSVIDDLQSQINENKTQISSVNTKATNNEILINTNTSLINQYSTNMSNLTNKSSSDNVFLKTYPIGSIYVSTSSANPGNTFGGTWVSFGTGRTLVGVDSSQTEFATVEKTGGEKTHTLTVDEMPSHNHLYEYSTDNGLTYSSTQSFGIDGTYTQPYYFGGSNSVSSYESYKGRIGYTGGSKAHNNLQPYITVYMWKRTA